MPKLWSIKKWLTLAYAQTKSYCAMCVSVSTCVGEFNFDQLTDYLID